MHIVTVSMTYKNTPVHIRERFSMTKDALPAGLVKLKNMKSILECVILSTCNRVEIIAVVDQLHTGRHFIKTFLSEWFQIDRQEFIPYLDIRENDDAIRYICDVTIGLDSMILGETQVLGQVKDAFMVAQESGATGTIFNRLFQQIIKLAKRAHSETDIGQNAVSVSYAAIELGKKIYGDLQSKSVLILGAGKMSELTAKHLHANGVSDVYVVNRTMERAQELSARFNGAAYDFEQREELLKDVDIVISSTGADRYVINKEMVERVMRHRLGRPLFLIDIAVPRDLDPTIHEVDNAFLYDIDDLNGIVEANLEERKLEAEKIKEMISLEMEEFKAWLNTLGVVPIISALRSKALTIQEETMQSMMNKLPDLGERERKIINKHTKSIVNQLMKDPILRLKEMAAEPEAKKSLEAFTSIFALEELLQEEMASQQKLEQAKQLANKLNKDQQQKQEDRQGRQELPVHL